jgi:hypothetical protein
MHSRPYNRSSDRAARQLLEQAAEDDNWEILEELLGETDCPSGCYVEPDGHCPHGWESAGLTAGMV